MCRRCVAKIQRFKKSKKKNHPKFPGDQGKYCVFKTHNEYLVSEGTCYICSHSQRQSPRKRLGVALEENKSISEGKKARKQLFEVRPSEAGPSSSSQKTVIDHEPRTDTKSLNNVELTGIHLDRFVERDFAQIFQCTVCLDVPSNAVILAGCRHVFCEPCIRQWLTFRDVCPSCRQVTDLEDISPLKKQMLEVFELLTVKCKYSCNGCTEVIKASLLTEHEAHCKFSHIKHKKRGSYNKVKLYDISRQYAKRRRLLPMFSMLDEFCDLNNENTEDVLFSMLATTLYDNGKKELANKIEYLWVQQTDYILTADECLASRVDLLQTKNQYREQFDYLNSKGQYVFKPPNQVDSVEIIICQL